MTDWLMVIITAIYVVATIFICVFNGKSAKAANEQSDIARKQMQQMIEQYNSVNRPIVSIRFDIVRSGLLCFIIENEGPLPARNTKIRINSEFIANVENEVDGNRLSELCNASFYLASHQKITVLLGGQRIFNEIAKEKAKIDISYDGYDEHTEIDINQYRFLIVYDSSIEDISQHLKKMKQDNEKFHRSIVKAMEKSPQIHNVVVHSTTEDESNKFRVFKEVCLSPNSTVVQISEKLGFEKDYTNQLLLELLTVDKLIAFTFHEVTDDEDKALWYRR
ncbi:MAG: hypothetical protein ACI4RL_07115 [Ruminococcus sp.]